MYFNLVYRIYNYLQAVLNVAQLTVLEILVWFGHHCFCKTIYFLRIKRNIIQYIPSQPPLVECRYIFTDKTNLLIHSVLITNNTVNDANQMKNLMIVKYDEFNR